MPLESSVDEDTFDFPLGLSTHERCSDPCPQFRDRIDGREEFEPIGKWGPKIETAKGETIAKGHESVRLVLDAILGEEPIDTRSCYTHDCNTEATHTVEIGRPPTWFTAHACVECADPNRSTVNAVYEGLETKPCLHDRCFNVVHESRDYCPSHRFE